jgi:hypothetical protein
MNVGVEEAFVVRGFIPDGLRSSPLPFWLAAGSLRNPSGMNPLTTRVPADKKLATPSGVAREGA